MSKIMPMKTRHVVMLCLLPLCILAIYYPGLAGGFVFDDFTNIVQQTGIAMHELSWNSLKAAALSMDGRPLARASFGLTHLVWGFDAFYFKAVNIVIHCINALLVFALTQLLLKQYLANSKSSDLQSRATLIALATAFCWALHPVNLTSVLYIVQRINSLSALFVLAGMYSYAKGRLMLTSQPLAGWLLITASVLVFLPMAWYSKENGALLICFIFIMEITLFQFRGLNDRQRHALYLFHGLFVLIPVVIALIYIFQHAGMFQAGYGNRYFSMSERLLTEPRILWLYIRMIAMPIPSLFGLFHDDITVSTSFSNPASTLPAMIGLVILFILALGAVKRAPIFAFGLLFFFAGHLMESTFIPLELAFEHRNYLPSVGLLVILFYYLGYGFSPGKYVKARLSITVIFISLLAMQTHLRAWQWSDNVRIYLTEVQFHPDSPRANYEAGKVYGQRLERGEGNPQTNYREAIKHFERVTALRDNTTSGLFGSILASIDSGHDVKPEWIEELAGRLANQPLEQVNLLWLDKLTDCVSKGKCRKQDIQISRLVTAALQYQNLNNKNKSYLYVILAKYFYRVERNLSKAIEMSKKALSSMPSNLHYHLTLVKYLITAGNRTEASRVLESAAKLDIYGKHNKEIFKLRVILKGH